MKNHKKSLIVFLSLLLTGIIGYAGERHLSTSSTELKSERKTRAIAAESLLINEIQVANNGMFLDPSFNFGGWIELYNATDSVQSLQNIFISDDITNLRKCRLVNDSTSIVGKGYHVLWFGLNLDTPSNMNFSLNYDGGILYFSDENGTILLSQIYPPAISRTSYARKTDGGAEWGVTGEPSPGRSNLTSTFAVERLQAPVVDTDSQLFTSPFTFKVSYPVGSTLKYTTDGSAPGISNGLTTTDSIFTVDHTSVYRFCLIQNDKLPSKIVTRSFIKDKYHTSLPILSLVIEKDYLYDDSIGIFVRGVNGKTGNGQSSPCNWNMDWSRPSNIELLTTDGKMVINQEVEIANSGAWSRAYSPHSFKIKAKKKFEGENFIPYSVFKNRPHLKYKTLKVRNGGNDTENRMVDAALQHIAISSGIDIDAQDCTPVLNFINGKFIGLLNLREPNNKDYVYSHFGWDETAIDQFKICGDSNYCQRCGTDEAFLNWYHLSANAQDVNVYKEICQLVDIDEYINYMAIEMFLGCTDYGKNNIKGFRPRIPGGKFRIMLFDIDSALNTDDPLSFFEYRQWHTFHYDSDNDGDPREEIKFVTIFLNMLENADFRKQFIDTYSLVCGSIFEPQRCAAIIDSMAQQRVEPLMLENKSPLQKAEELKTKLNGRPEMMIHKLKHYARMKMSGIEELNVKLSSDLDISTLKVNDINVPTNKFDGTLFLPITLKAEAPAGYKFVGWQERPLVNGVPLIKWGDQWKYYDQGSLNGISWQDGTDCATWKEGMSPMGYNLKYAEVSQKFKTTLDYGPNIRQKRSAYYFYREFSLAETPMEENKFILNLDIDDGAVVYINGKEVDRYLMPEGQIDYETFATNYAHAWPNRHQITVSPDILKQGKNSIAVEIHNSSSGSSDIYFDCELTMTQPNKEPGKIICTDDTYPITKTESIEMVACFESLSEDEQSQLIPPVVINEVSADNTMFINEYFNKNDWVELYNRTNDTIDIAGMYLSDSRINPHKYQIVKDMNKYATKIAPHGHLVLWADLLPSGSQIHTGFKLAREGGEVILTAADESWADTLIYEAHSDKYSVGRYPDGEAQLYIMTMPTLGKANSLNSYATMFEEPLYPVGIEETVMPMGEEVTMKYVNGELCIYGNTMSPVGVSLYNISGQKLMQHKVDLESGMAVIDLSHLRRGTYIAKACDAEGYQSIVKFLVTKGW